MKRYKKTICVKEKSDQTVRLKEVLTLHKNSMTIFQVQTILKALDNSPYKMIKTAIHAHLEMLMVIGGLHSL